MTTAKPATMLDASLPTSAASDAHHALARPILPNRPRYTGRMPAWAWLAIFGLCIAAALPVIRTSSVTESGTELRALEAERERLNSEIRSLAAHVGQLGSLARVKQQAEERLNMVPARPTVSLEVTQPPPARTMPARFLPPAQRTGGDLSESSLAVDRSVWNAMVDVLIFD
jgi:cell division protein FtsL